MEYVNLFFWQVATIETDKAEEVLSDETITIVISIEEMMAAVAAVVSAAAMLVAVTII